MLFERVPAQTSGVTFSNTITTSDSFNILTYEYLYNGGGVGIGDFNNDSLPDVFFSGQMVACKLFLNQGNFAFNDITEKAGINTKGIWAYGVSVIDINQDGWLDIYLCTGGKANITGDVTTNKLFINNKDLTFKESAAEYGLTVGGESIQAAFFDYDRDGDLDMYLLKGGGFEKSAITPFPIARDGSSRNTDRLYRNDFDPLLGHAHFTNVSKEAGILIEGFGLGVSILDVNEDAWPDVYVSNDYLGNDHLYVNQQDGTFINQIEKYFKHTSYFAMGNDVGDINNDGKFDVVTVDMLPEDNFHRKVMFGPNRYDIFSYAVSEGYGYQYMRNTLQLNNGNQSFSEIGQLAGISKTDWSWGPLLADFDNDGFQDLVITNGYGKDVTNLDYVKFRQAMTGVSKEERRRVLMDRPAINVPNYAYKNNKDNTFTKVTDEWGFQVPSLSSGLAYADFDLDGDLDLVINNIDQEAFMYRNKLIDRKTPGTNFIRVKLIGTLQNKNGVDAVVTVKTSNLLQVRNVNPVRGFESSSENILHFGLGKELKVDTIEVKWNDGKVSHVVNVSPNQVITINYEGSLKPQANRKLIHELFLSPIKAIDVRHIEAEYNDFLYQPLLQHKLSQEGPGIAVGDINQDGLEDIFVGGSYRMPAYLITQNNKGRFKSEPFFQDFESEDMGSLFFDADADGDLDLYVVSGGVEFFKAHKHYQDRLYRNDGKGNFTKDESALPELRSSGSCVVAGDYDADGDLDLFVGGRVIPNMYPKAPQSYLLRNDDGKFVDVTASIAPSLGEIGMVTSALWSDVDNNYTLDLILVGEAMPITVFENASGKFTNKTIDAGLADSNGFWNSLVSGDFDNDGDTDFVAGNLGLNGPMKTSIQEPITIHYADFDENGSLEPIIGYYESGKNYPVYPLDILTAQLPGLKKKILYHKDYAASTMEDIIRLTGSNSYNSIFCKTLESSFIRNNGSGKFELIPLPQQAQIAPVYGLLAEDVDGDGNLDLLGVGNSFAPEIIYGRFDALRGLTFLGDGKGGFRYMGPEKSGFFVEGDGKGIVRMETPNGPLIVASQNNDSIKSFAMSSQLGRRAIKVGQNEASAILYLSGGRMRKLEMNFGSTYLSQSSRTILINNQVDSVVVKDNKGRKVRSMISGKTLP
jgi:enediyne biosynthesis protein E4